MQDMIIHSLELFFVVMTDPILVVKKALTRHPSVHSYLETYIFTSQLI